MASLKQFTIGVVQMSCWPNMQENLAKAVTRVEEAAGRGAQVICLPELFRSQYFCQKEDPALFDLAESVPGPATEALAPVARKHQVVILAPIFERRAPGLYHNSAVVIDASGEIAAMAGDWPAIRFWSSSAKRFWRTGLRRRFSVRCTLGLTS